MFRDSLLRKIMMGLIVSEGEGDGGGGGNGDAGESGENSGGDSGNYYDSFPSDVQAWDEVKNADTPEKFWQQITEARSHIGQSIRIPGKDAGDDDWNTFNEKLQKKVPTLMKTPDFDNKETLGELYAKMGRPETPTDYNIPEVKNEEGKVITLDEKRIKSVAPILHAAGLSQKQFNDLVSTVALNDSITVAGNRQKFEVDKAKLTEEWGAAHKQNSEIVTSFAKKFGAPAGLQKGIEAGMVNSETMLWLHSLATKSLGQVADFQGDVTAKNDVMTPAEANTQISEIMNNRKHSYWNKMDPGHAEAVARVRKLYLLKDPKGGESAPGTTFNVGG